MIRKSIAAAAALALLAGCASLSPDGGTGAVQELSRGRTGGVDATLVREPTAQTQGAIRDLLSRPLTAEAAVRIALLNNPQLQASLAALGIGDAERVQAGSIPNPHVAIGRLTEGSSVEIERMLSFNVVGLLTLPWRSQWAGRQNELARLQAAQDVVRLAAQTRKAWIEAVAASQTEGYMRDVQDAALAGAELGRRMGAAGNWSRLQQAREQLFLADATAQLARAQHSHVAAREKLTRLMGLWGGQTQFTLAGRLPDLPAAAREISDVEAQAISQRLDVRAARDESRYVAESLGFTRATGFIDAMELGYSRNTTFDNAAGTREVKRGFELELPLPIFDWGKARNARAEASYLQSAARVHDVAVTARSEAREAYHRYRTAHDLAKHYQGEVVPLRKLVNDEIVLRYNGMLASVWEVLADVRLNVAAVNASIEAQRDFWLAETDLQTSLTGTSPGGLAALQATGANAGAGAQGH